MVWKQEHGVTGLIPPEVFYAEAKPGGGYYFLNRRNRKEGAALLMELAPAWLGLTKGRLWLVLGGAWHADSLKVGKRSRLSQAFLERLNYLFWLKGAKDINVGSIHLIDWKGGIVYFNEGEQFRFTAQQNLPVSEPGIGQPLSNEGSDSSGNGRGHSRNGKRSKDTSNTDYAPVLG